MNNSFFIKNALVLSLDKESRAGYFNIEVRNGKITQIDYEQNLKEEDYLKSVPGGKVIDASDKIIMPGFMNASINSAYSLNKIFFKKCSFENISNNVPLRLVKKFLTNPSSKDLLKQLFSINYTRSLRNGEVFINETSPVITKDFYDSYVTKDKWKQYHSFVVFDHILSNHLKDKNIPFILGYKPADDINNYSLSSLKKLVKSAGMKLYLEVSQSHNNVEALRHVFGKPFIEILDDFDLLSSDTLLHNPVFLTHREINKLKDNNVNLIFSPSDYLKFSNKPFDPVEYFSAELNVMIGTGLQGKDILSELKIMSTLLHKYNFPYEKLMRLVTTNPANSFNISNITGSIENGKSADMIFFTLDDVRNLMTLPEIDAEKLSEFIIEELSVKDISDIIINGHFLVVDGKESYKSNYNSIADEIAEKLYEEGKYFEFKEKYLRRKRVNEVSLKKEKQSESEMPNDVFDDNFDIDSLKDDSEFRIIGKKFPDDFRRTRSTEGFFKNLRSDYNQIPEIINNLSEISSLDEGFNLIPEEDEKKSGIEEVEKPVSETDDGKQKALFTDTPAEYKNKTGNDEREKQQSAPGKEDNVVYKKDKMRFGFSEED